MTQMSDPTFPARPDPPGEDADPIEHLEYWADLRLYQGRLTEQEHQEILSSVGPEDTDAVWAATEELQELPPTDPPVEPRGNASDAPYDWFVYAVEDAAWKGDISRAEADHELASLDRSAGKGEIREALRRVRRWKGPRSACCNHNIEIFGGTRLTSIWEGPDGAAWWCTASGGWDDPQVTAWTYKTDAHCKACGQRLAWNLEDLWVHIHTGKVQDPPPEEEGDDDP